MADILTARALLMATVVTVALSGCGAGEPRWQLDAQDLGVEVDTVPFDDQDDNLLDDLTCGIGDESWSEAKVRWSTEAEVSQYRGQQIAIQIFVVPYNADHAQTREAVVAPGSALRSPRTAMSYCAAAMERSDYESRSEIVGFDMVGDASEVAISADGDPSSSSEPLGWSEHAEGPFKNPDLLIIDGMEDRYAEGYYAMVGDTYVGVHVVSSVEPEVSAEQVMDVMREKLEADPPEARYAGGEVSR
ncbi:hypothetical protein [Paraoerskovia marina]|uniref:hypothetical protein n=1 Tax=Paraoerskovia marina TaxID=545619 RepID=UPI000492DA7B|nr:hypothetical protein [Paraoerskovia marina]